MGAGHRQGEERGQSPFVVCTSDELRWVNNPGYSPDVRFCPDVGAQAAAREPHVE
eukprot:CAMPEP_0175952394 /NCGR_PEP_ID=MMETSP0108-20121206/30726_1 /TAXON_ID=195067 ORGANISM="Goniomonas pacifica, Strain CCMP1869" /NCGR_SAMPLE_ID=MMETSP0108 /ASSEMBLY_ACC=CAM_ASM_000204 /LENGTH=54 /DNA_ID=CAMNT_0017278749 /DNA_START=1 /DNA_END=162 /DNA_ORIENTATION=-